jgi:DNA polymerase
MYYAGQQFRAGVGLSTMHPSLDWETYSEAGLVWNADEQKWQPPRGCQGQTRGLRAVGTFNYVWHPTFEPLSLAYDLLDGRGMRHWVPVMTDVGLASEPHDLLAHVAAGGILAAFNVYFERTVWSWCVARWGWPVWHLENSRCDMAKSQVAAYPPSLEAVGDLLLPEHLRKDKAGHALVRKLTMPKNPSKARKSPQMVLV